MTFGFVIPHGSLLQNSFLSLALQSRGNVLTLSTFFLLKKPKITSSRLIFKIVPVSFHSVSLIHILVFLKKKNFVVTVAWFCYIFPYENLF